MKKSYNRRHFLTSLSKGSLSLCLSGAGILNSACKRSGKSDKPPNIILIVLDELGYYELSCLGHPLLSTPNIDQMAAHGMRFSQALAGSSVCAPSRSTLMTGQHTGHTTVRDNRGDLALREEDLTIAEVLKSAGYTTGGFGKWGLGDRGTTGVPERHGFDEFYGYYHQVHAHSYYPNYLVHNGQKVPLTGNSGDFYQGNQFSHYLIVEEAKKFISRNKSGPFFCYCPWAPPHGLWAIPEDDPAWLKYKDYPWTAGQQTKNDAKVYAAMVNMVDRQIGELLDMLKDFGIDKDTIVMVCGDNGGQEYFRNGDPTGLKLDSPPYPNGFFAPNLNPVTGKRFRGGKRNLYEGGLRIPMIVRWPERIPPGTVSDHLCYFPDLMPTFAELAGTGIPQTTDGLSFVPTLCPQGAAGSAQRQHEFLYWEFREQKAVRKGDWKCIQTGKNRPFELYDLSEDIEEKKNLAGTYHDILKQMVDFAHEAHTQNVMGRWLDRSQQFRGHLEK